MPSQVTLIKQAEAPDGGPLALFASFSPAEA
jgi:hypothetical protein